MNSTLPEQLKAAADALLEGVSRKDLALRSAAITAHYRGGQGSRAAITGKQDALAYLVARLPATYAVAAAVLGLQQRRHRRSFPDAASTFPLWAAGQE